MGNPFDKLRKFVLNWEHAAMGRLDEPPPYDPATLEDITVGDFVEMLRLYDELRGLDQGRH